MSIKLLSALLCVAVFASAAPTAGTVTAAGSIKLNETNVPATAAASLPVALGDRVSTTDSEAVIRFQDLGALVTLNPHSSVLTGETQGKPFIRLLAGSLSYKLTDTSNLLIFKQNQPVPAALDGVVAIAGHSKKVPIVLATAAGAAAVITTVGLANPSPTCPPGQVKKGNGCGKN
jgi:hypothetical protein